MMFEDIQLRPTSRSVSPYRTLGHVSGSGTGAPSGWVVFFIDGSVVLVIAISVLTIGWWSSFVDVAAQRFLGF